MSAPWQVDDKAMPVRVNMVTVAKADGIEPVRVGAQSQWVIFRARTEAWLVNGSYNSPGKISKGASQLLRSAPGVLIQGLAGSRLGEEEIGMGHTIKFYRFLQDSGPAFAALALGAVAISDHQSAMG